MATLEASMTVPGLPELVGLARSFAVRLSAAAGD
jgi:hypothetical protein